MSQKSIPNLPIQTMPELKTSMIVNNYCEYYKLSNAIGNTNMYVSIVLVSYTYKFIVN